MGNWLLTLTLLVAVDAPLALSATTSRASQAPAPAKPPVRAADPRTVTEADGANSAAETMASFTNKVAEYTALQEAQMAALPKLTDNATPAEIDRHQRALAALMVKARPAARRGEFFDPAMAQVVRVMMRDVFADPERRAELKASVEEDNPRGIRLAVNGRYPDQVPLTTMPPQVLKNLPRLPTDMEFRFVGDSLILLDVRAHLVVDYMTGVLA